MTDTSQDNMEALHEQRDWLLVSPEAWEVAEELVLLDIGLPKLNGYDVARHIRQQPWGHGATLIALTGWGKDEDRRLSQEARFNFHLIKSVDLAALEGLLNGVQTTVV